MEALLIELAKQGVLAFVAAVAVWFAIRKDKQVTALYDRLTRKSENYLNNYHHLASELNGTLSALANALEVEVSDVASRPVSTPTQSGSGRTQSQ